VRIVSARTRLNPEPSGVIDGIPIHRFDFFEALATKSLGKIFEIINAITVLKRSFQPHLVHVNFTEASPFFHLRTARPSEATIVVFHDQLTNRPSAWPMAKILSTRGAALVAPSFFLAQDVVAVLRQTRSTVHAIPHGVPVEPFISLPKPRSDGPPIFLGIGRVVEEKGFQIAVQAIALLAERGLETWLRIVGAGNFSSNLIELASSLRIGKNVHCLGAVAPENLPAEIRSSKAVLVPSLFSESFGMTACEAALAGRPVIASRIGALPEVVKDRQTGLLVEPKSPTELASAIELLMHDKVLACRLATAARQRARSIYNCERMADAYEALYYEQIQ
jgi:glycogen synthase